MKHLMQNLDEAITFTGVVIALDRAVTRARGLVGKMSKKWLGKERMDVAVQLEGYAKELLNIAKEFKE
jgi:hypothetical protein